MISGECIDLRSRLYICVYFTLASLDYIVA